MKTAVVFAHPWHGSFNMAILQRAVEKLRAEEDDFVVLDLYRDGFDPVMSESDLALYAKGESGDPLVKKYNAVLDEAQRIIFIFPIWWYDMPAILRGFFDKVMLSGSAYLEDEAGMHPLRNIGETLLITTSSAPTESLIGDFGDPVHGTIIAGTFKAVGFHNAKWHNLGGIGATTQAQREGFLQKVWDLL